MSNRTVINLDGGYKLVAEQNADPSYNREIFIGIEDDGGVWHQTLAVVRNSYTFNHNLDVIWKNKEFNVLVWGDKDNEDYTDYFTIGLHEEEEHEV